MNLRIRCASGSRRGCHKLQASLVGLLTAASLLACAAQGGRTVTRRIDGEWISGPEVPAAAYAHYLEAERQLASGTTDSAVNHFEQALLALPQPEPYLLLRLAAVHLEQAEEGAAAQLMAEAEMLEPCSDELWWMRGRHRQAQGDAKGAMAAYHRALRCAPGRARSSRALSDLLEAQGAPYRAFQCLRDFARRTGHWHSAQRLVSLAIQHLTATELRNALALAKALEAVDPARRRHWRVLLQRRKAPEISAAFDQWLAANIPEPAPAPALEPTPHPQTPGTRDSP